MMFDSLLPKVYLVVDEQGIHGAYLDAQRAYETAAAIEGVVAFVPIHASFRPCAVCGTKRREGHSADCVLAKHDPVSRGLQ